MKLQQLFCKHIYKIIEEEYLRTSVADINYLIGAREHYAVTYKCVKCNRIVIKEQSRQMKNEL